MSPIPLGFWATAGAGGATGPSYDLIETVYGNGSSTTLTFSSIPNTYKHLQIRMTARTARASTVDNVGLILNGDVNSANYYSHRTYTEGGPVYSDGRNAYAFMFLTLLPGNTATANSFGTTVIDIADYTSTSKNKTVKAIGGLQAGISEIAIYSGTWFSTAAVSSISVRGFYNQAFLSGSRISLYGIKG